MSKLRPMGDIMLDLENIVCEMADSHDMQKGEILGLVSQYIDVHLPESIEEYEDGTSPIYYYGPKKD